MADTTQLDLLRRSVPEWNAWRGKHSEEKIDLQGTYLSKTDLRGLDLSNANLHDADLSNGDLSNANLHNADLRGANLYNANLHDADLSNGDLLGTFLSCTDFRNANLSGADLSGADIISADFRNTNLVNADFSRAIIGGTVFGDRDFRQIKGLDTIHHDGPLPLSINSIYLSGGGLPEVFMRGTGAPDTFIEYMRSLTAHSIEYYTCFISYSSKDQVFAERLYNDLQGCSVRCWYAPKDLKTGDFFWKRIDESVRLFDKLLVVLSSHSIESDWVEREVMAALEKEQQQRRPVLFPLRLDDAVKAANNPWAADMRRRRHITDFTGWETDYTIYQASLKRVLRDLKQEKA